VEGELSCSRVSMVLASKFSFAFTTLRRTPANRWIPSAADGMVDRHGSVSAEGQASQTQTGRSRYEGGAGKTDSSEGCTVSAHVSLAAYCRIVATPPPIRTSRPSAASAACCSARRHLAPPTFPALVRPGAADRTEHVPTKNPGTNADQSAFRNIVVDARFTTLKSLHSAPYARVEEPLHDLGSTNAKWILKILARSGTEAVNAYRETLDAYPWHDCSLVGLICKASCGGPPHSWLGRPVWVGRNASLSLRDCSLGFSPPGRDVRDDVPCVANANEDQ